MFTKLFIALIAVSMIGVLVGMDAAYALQDPTIQNAWNRKRDCFVGEGCIDVTAGFHDIAKSRNR